MATQWAPSPLHSRGKIRVFLLQEVLFAPVVNSVGKSEYGHYTAKAQESPLKRGKTSNKIVQLLAQHCRTMCCRMMFLILPPLGCNSCATKSFAQSCSIMLQKVDQPSTFHNNILDCCPFYHSFFDVHTTKTAKISLMIG